MGGVANMLFLYVPLALCLIVGIALLVVEVFMPGFGIPGISGFILICAGIWITWNSLGTTAGLAAAAVSFILAGISVVCSLKSAAGGRLFRSSLFLKDTSSGKEPEHSDLTGKTGKTVTVLNPVGFAEIDGKRLNVITEGCYLEKGKTVEVIRSEGNRIVVQEREE